MWISVARGLTVVAAAFVVLAAADGWRVRGRLADGVRTDGEVVSVRTETSHVRHSSELGDSGETVESHVATVRYADDAGAMHTIVTDPLGRDVHTGDRLTVLYSPDSPQNAMALTAASPWDRPLSLMGVGTGFGLFAFLAYALGRSRGEGPESKRPPGLLPERP